MVKILLNIRFLKTLHIYYRSLLFFILLLFSWNMGWGQLSITSLGTAYTQNFDGLPTSGTANAQSGSIFSSGWSFLEAGTNANLTFSAGTGSSTTGDTYSFGVAGVNALSDRAFGMLQSGSLSSIIGFKFTNNTGSTITSLTIGYTGEVWRLNSGGDNLACSYQISDVALNAATGWTVVAGLAFSTPVTGTAAAVDGNNSSNRTVISPVTISGLNIPNGTTVTFRWVDGTTTSSAGMGIDDFSITANGTAPSPMISTSGTLTSVNTIVGTASSNTSFSVSGSSLTNDITITAPTGFELSTNASSGFSSSITLTQASGTVNATTVYVHLAATTAVGTYSDTIRIASTGASSVALYMPPSTVFPNTGGTPTLYGVGTLTAMTTSAGIASTPNQTFTVSGSNLGANNITITAPAGFEISTNASSGYATSLTLTPSADGFVGVTTIYIHIAASTTAGSYSGNVVIAASGAVSVNISVPLSTVTLPSQTITFNLTSSKTNVDVIRIPVKSSSGLPVTLTATPSNIVTITSVTTDTFLFTFTGVGTVTITASQAGNGSYAAATDVVRTINVLNAISKWTFESVTLSGTATTPTIGGVTTADLGLQTSGSSFNAYHASASTTWSYPSGNGSVVSVSSTNWAPGDYYEFQTSTADFHGIGIMFDHTGSNTGPRDFKLQYSVNGTTFTDYATYSVPNNSGANIGWSANYLKDTSQLTFDLSSITSLNNATTVWFRIVDNGTTSINGTTVGTAGTSRIDNFRVTGMPNAFYSKATGNWELNTTWNIFAGGTPIAAPYGVFPKDSLSDVTINGPHTVTTTAIAYANNLNLQGTLSLSSTIGNDLYLAGSWTKGTGVLTQNDRVVNFYTASNATITATGGQSFSYLKLNKTTSSNKLSLADSISVSKDFTITSGTFDLANKNVTLLSSASAGTAGFGAMGINGVINYSGTGRFIVERYIATGTGAGKHGKSWQFLAIPTTGDNQTINAAWQEGATSVSQNPKSGYGIQLSGPGGTAAGFDTVTLLPSMKTYNSTNNNWTGIPTTNGVLYNAKGYMVFVRGDRSVRSYAQAATQTILRSKGKLFGNGNLPPSTNVVAGTFESIGNPYASAVDFTLLTKSNVDNVFYVWDPLLTSGPASQYGLGGYQTISAATGYLPTPGGTTNYPSNTACTTIQSGQAFLVRSSSVNGSVSFAESAKSAGSRLVNRNLIDPSSINMLSTNLITVDNTSEEMVDGNKVVFDNSYSNTVDENDAVKLLNNVENFSLTRTQRDLAIEARAPLAATDTLFYNMTGLREATYRLQFVPQHLSSVPLPAFLIDKYLNVATPVSLTDTTSINFTVSSDLASKDSSRFMLVFKMPSAPLPVIITSISAFRKSENIIQIDWKVDNEINIDRYEVERSSNGRNFGKITTVATVSNNGYTSTYTSTDQYATANDNFYRIKAVSQNGMVQYSAIVKVSGKEEAANVSLYSNPVKNGLLQIKFNNQIFAQSYAIQLTNTMGQLIYDEKWKLGTGNQILNINLGGLLSPGIYQLKIVSASGEVKLLRLLAQ